MESLDFDGDYDADAFDRQMQDVFGSQYYANVGDSSRRHSQTYIIEQDADNAKPSWDDENDIASIPENFAWCMSALMVVQ